MARIDCKTVKARSTATAAPNGSCCHPTRASRHYNGKKNRDAVLGEDNHNIKALNPSEALPRVTARLCDVVLPLTSKDFYNSMTTHADYRVWQDVYHGQSADGVALYVKLTVLEDVLIVSFKDL